MKKKLLLSLGLSLTLMGGVATLTSCNSGPTLKVFNWGEYIDLSLLREFEKEYHCKVRYSTFNSNENAVIQATNNSFDVIVPSDYAIEELAKKGRLKELDWEKLYNAYHKIEEENQVEVKDAREQMTSLYTDFVNNITTRMKEDTNSFDFYKYAAPYFSGNVGIVYNKDKVSEEMIQEKGWDIVREGSLKVAYYDNPREGFMVPLKELGYSMNTTSEKEIDEAYDWLVEQRRRVKNLTYVTDEVLDGMIFGTYDVAIVYSGDACYVMGESELNLDFYVPSNGTNVWVDGMVIPTNATQVDLAYNFIAFMTRANSGYKNAMEVSYTPTTKEALDMYLNDEEVLEYREYYSYVMREKDEIYRYNESIKTYMDNKWQDALNS